MAFPKIHYCLICDDVREERAKKTSILGFFGIAPNVEILVKDLSQPIDRLAFVLVGGSGDGKFKVRPKLLDKDGHPIVDPGQDVEVTVPSSVRSSNMAFGFAPVRFPVPGTYTFQLLVNGSLHYETRFDIKQGKPEDFA